MQTREAFTSDPLRVVHETIDGEAILIDLSNGVYYSLTGSGPDIWELLLAGCTVDEVAGELERRYPNDRDAVAPAVGDLTGQLLAAGLLQSTGDVSSPAALATRAATGDAFPLPVLQTYTDMEYFLLLDPVHDVQDAGWPHAKGAASVDPGH